MKDGPCKKRLATVTNQKIIDKINDILLTLVFDKIIYCNKVGNLPETYLCNYLKLSLIKV